MSNPAKFFGEVKHIYEQLTPVLNACCLEQQTTGSFRRGLKSMDSLEIVAVPNPQKMEQVRGIGASWGKRYRDQDSQTVMTGPSGFKVIIHWARRSNFGLKLARTTGSAPYWGAMLEHLKTHGVSETSERLLAQDGSEIETPDERKIFELAWVDYVPPERRTISRG